MKLWPSQQRGSARSLRAVPQRFDLVITDQTMPQMTGDAWPRPAAYPARHPHHSVYGLQPYDGPGERQDLRDDAWLAKPWQARELATHDPEGLRRAAPSKREQKRTGPGDAYTPD